MGCLKSYFLGIKQQGHTELFTTSFYEQLHVVQQNHLTSLFYMIGLCIDYNLRLAVGTEQDGSTVHAEGLSDVLLDILYPFHFEGDTF